MSYSNQDIKQFLSFVPPFSRLSPEVLENLASKMQLLRYRMGQLILLRDKMPPHVAIICEGEARWLGYDPRDKMPTSLKLLSPGSVVGAVNLIRGIPCETAIASKEVVCLILNNQDFLNLLQEYPEIRNTFTKQAPVVEVFDLLGYQLQQETYSGNKNLRDLATVIAEAAEVYYLAPGNHNISADSPLKKQDKVWLVSGGGEITGFPVGSRLNLTNGHAKLDLEVKGNAARLIGIPLDHWITPQDKLGGANGSLTPRLTASESLVKEGEEIPYADSELPVDKSFTPTHLPKEEEKKSRKELKDYPFFPGKTPVEAACATFRMMSKYFGMPFRREVVERILNEQYGRTGTIALPICGAIAELMGLNAQLVAVPGKALTRIEAPVLTRWQDSLVIIYEINDQELIIGVPEVGVIRRTPAEFLETWQDENGQGKLILLKKTKETPQDNFGKFGLRWFLPYVSRYRQVLIEVFVASFFVQLFALANPLMIRIIIDKVISEGSVDTLVWLVSFLVILAIFEAVLNTLRTYLFVDTTNRIDMALGSQIIDHLLRLPLRYFERRPVGEIATRINELENIRQFMTGTALTVLLDAIFSVLYIGVMLAYSPLLTAVALSIIPVFVLLTIIFSPTIRQQLRTKAERNAQTQSYLVEVMTGIQTVKAQNIELRSRWQWQERYARYISAGFKTVITSTIAGSASTFLNKVSSVLIIGVGSYLALKGEISLGQLIAFRIIAGYVTSPVMRLAQLWQNFQQTALSLERLADIVDTPEEGELDRFNIPMPAIQGAVRYENVSFRFKTNGPLQLNRVNLNIAAGQFVAIVGQSGAGKSTVTKLLARLYEPESGRIFIDGYDINKVELYSLRRQIGVVPQDTLLFEGTVQENIALTHPDASTEEIIAAAKVAAAHEFIMALPQGYNTRVGERGSSLSGGQRQRIALARTVLQNPRMLILDEATSALDYATEQEVCINLAEHFRHRTIFFITHRLGTIQHADVIVMMENGSVVEEGTHEELMAMQGRYYYLYQQQQSVS